MKNSYVKEIAMAVLLRLILATSLILPIWLFIEYIPQSHIENPLMYAVFMIIGTVAIEKILNYMDL